MFFRLVLLSVKIVTLIFCIQIYDDLDLPFASLKLLPKGGHGGHNGYILPLLVPFLLYMVTNDCVLLHLFHILCVRDYIWLHIQFWAHVLSQK